MACDAGNVFHFLVFTERRFMMIMALFARNLPVFPFQVKARYTVVKATVGAQGFKGFFIVTGLTILAKLVLMWILVTARAIRRGNIGKLGELLAIFYCGLMAFVAVGLFMCPI